MKCIGTGEIILGISCFFCCLCVSQFPGLLCVVFTNREEKVTKTKALQTQSVTFLIPPPPAHTWGLHLTCREPSVWSVNRTNLNNPVWT